MELINFYREQFLELCSQFEPDWKEDANEFTADGGSRGYRWQLSNTEFIEEFQIVKPEDTPLYLLFLLELPYDYQLTNIAEFSEHYSSEYGISVHYYYNKTELSSTISVDSLNQSVLGFINRARGELIDIVYSIVQQNS